MFDFCHSGVIGAYPRRLGRWIVRKRRADVANVRDDRRRHRQSSRTATATAVVRLGAKVRMSGDFGGGACSARLSRIVHKRRVWRWRHPVVVILCSAGPTRKSRSWWRWARTTWTRLQANSPIDVALGSRVSASVVPLLDRLGRPSAVVWRVSSASGTVTPGSHSVCGGRPARERQQTLAVRGFGTIF